jgi:Lon protease-like protein
MARVAEIPLFPLKTVLFPGMPLPLRIFEERYKVMLRELLESGGCFGVLLIRDGEEVGDGAIPHDVGTTARIEECQELEGGRFALSARGVQRFRLVRMLEPRPYPYGQVELIEDQRGSESASLQRAVETVRATFPSYIRLTLSLSDEWIRSFSLPRAPHELVDFAAPWLRIDEEIKQRLLEARPPLDRVALLAEVLDDLIGRLQEEAAEHRRHKFGALGTQN